MCCEAMEMGLFATPAIYPAVPKGHAVIRTSVTAAHTRQHLEKGLSVLAVLAKRHSVTTEDPSNLPPAREMDLAEAIQQALLERGAHLDSVMADGA